MCTFIYPLMAAKKLIFLGINQVQIGQMFQNRATTCMDYEELLGLADGPVWGVSPGLATDNVPEKKKYIACCEKMLSS